MKAKISIPVILFSILALAAPTMASRGAADVDAQERFKSALNQVVQKVRAAETPAEKRSILNRFVDHMNTGIGRELSSSRLSPEDRPGLAAFHDKFQGYAAELKGQPGDAGVADADLDAFAGFMQQQMEQAQWSGGVYISAGALLVILLLLVLFT